MGIVNNTSSETIIILTIPNLITIQNPNPIIGRRTQLGSFDQY